MLGKWLVVATVVLVTLGVSALLYGLTTSGSASPGPLVSLEQLEEEEVIYLQDHDLFLVFNDGDPLALSDDAQHLGDRVEFCESSQMFESPAHGEKFDIHGSYYGGPGQSGLDRYPVRIEGDHLYVELGELIPGRERGAPVREPAGPLCVPG
jgi:nitrite reductase/ring-hydroxylating ferredoxin subunit